MRADDGTPVALGYHTGHWEVGLLVESAAEEFKQAGGVPFAAYCSDPCDGRTQGTTGMFDSLPYRNDAAVDLSPPDPLAADGGGVLGVATCDKGLPAMMMALAGFARFALRARARRRDAAARPSAKTRAKCSRSAPGSPRASSVAGRSGRAGLPGLRLAGRRLPVPRHGGHVAGGRRGAGACAAPRGAGPFSGQPIWLDMARRSARRSGRSASAASSWPTF